MKFFTESRAMKPNEKFPPSNKSGYRKRGANFSNIAMTALTEWKFQRIRCGGDEEIPFGSTCHSKR